MTMDPSDVASRCFTWAGSLPSGCSVTCHLPGQSLEGKPCHQAELCMNPTTQITVGGKGRWSALLFRSTVAWNLGNWLDDFYYCHLFLVVCNHPTDDVSVQVQNIFTISFSTSVMKEPISLTHLKNRNNLPKQVVCRTCAELIQEFRS